MVDSPFFCGFRIHSSSTNTKNCGDNDGAAELRQQRQESIVIRERGDLLPFIKAALVNRGKQIICDQKRSGGRRVYLRCKNPECSYVQVYSQLKVFAAAAAEKDYSDEKKQKDVVWKRDDAESRHVHIQ